MKKNSVGSESEAQDRAQERENPFGKIEKKVKTTMQEVNETVGHLKRRVITSREVQSMALRFEAFMQKRENPAFLLKMDEFSFSTGVLSMFLTFALLFYPDVNVLATWVTGVNMVLILIRFIDYKSKEWHYYFFDYCYQVNVGTWIYIWLLPRSSTAFFMMAMNAFCPLLNYFIIFNSKLIYQSRESLTSFFMHYTPAMLFLILRFYNSSNSNYLTAAEAADHLTRDGWRSQLHVFLLGLGFYAGWVLFYYLFIFHIRKKRIKTCGYQTLYSYTVEDVKKFNGLILRFGEQWGPISYMLLHLLQGLLGCLMSMLVLNFRWIAILALTSYLVFPIWNSSVYYFEYFSRDYNEKLVKRADQIKEKRMKRSSSTGNAPELKRKMSEEVKRSKKDK